MNEIEFLQERLRISAKYDFIIYPIDFSLLRKVLTAQQYQVAKPPPIDRQISGTTMIDLNGIIAKKDGMFVDSDAQSQILGINAEQADSMIAAFNQLEQGLSTELHLDVSTKARFYETILQFRVKTGKNPLEAMANLKKEYPKCKRMSEIFGQEVAPFSFRFSPEEIPVESENWFDFIIEPMISQATSTYYTNLVYRNHNRNNVIEQITKIKQTIIEALKVLEST